MFLYNSITRKKEKFVPINKDEVTMYNCGPTVYNYQSVGNYRSFLVADLLKRFLMFKGYKVKQVMNITDVGHLVSDEDVGGDVGEDVGEDKLELQAKKENKDPWEISKFYMNAFFQDIEKLNIHKAFQYPKATEHIEEMIEMIEILLKKGYAYLANKSIYFDLSKFPNYGKLSGNSLDDLIAGKRVCVINEKRNPYDFALWIHNPKHIMQWDSPWGKGYPGWHLECSAMSMKYLSETIDIHTGGEDNKFPHHECEIAQSEATTSKKFVNYWLHIKHLLIDNGKMSKSLGNVYSVNDIENRGFSLKALRYYLISGHYRQNLNFTFEGLKAAEKAVQKIQLFITNLKQIDNANIEIADILEKIRFDFEEALSDDLNISAALATIFNFMKRINLLISQNKLSKTNADEIIKLLKDIDLVLGVIDFSEEKSEGKESQVLDILLEIRDELRNEKNWKLADKIRDKLVEIGINIKDTKKG